MHRSHASRSAGSWAALIAAALLLYAAILMHVLTRNVFDATQFGHRSAASLKDSRVSAYAAERLTDAVLTANPDLIAARPFVVATATGIVSTEAFQGLLDAAARRTHQALFAEGTQRIALSLPDFQVLLRSAMAKASPQMAAKIPKEVDAVLAGLSAERNVRLLVHLWKLGRRLVWLQVVFFGLAPALFFLSIWLAPHRRHGLYRCGAAIAVCGLALWVLLPLGQLVFQLSIANSLERGFAQGLYTSFLSDLRGWGIFVAGFGLLICAGVTSFLERVDPAQRAAKIFRWLVLPPKPSGARALWGVVLLLTGTAAMAAPLVFLAGLAILAGIVGAYLGVRELFRLFLESVHALPQPEQVERAGGWRLPAAAAAALFTVLASLWFVFRNPSVQRVEAAQMICNGSPALCDLRVNQVTFAGAHNAMSNAEIPGWLFPHHGWSIPHQLDNGVRALLLDVHNGIPTASGVKTDLSREPDSAGKVRGALGEEGYNAAIRIRNRLAGEKEGKPGLFLCHGFCEIGGYELVPTLREIRDFFVANPEEVVVMVVEDYVEPAELAAAFEQSGLAHFVYRGPAGPEWPMLRTLVQSNQRLLVFLESGRAGVDYMRPAYPTFQETPYKFRTPEEFNCVPNRGGTEGPLFLVNHWIETTPAPRPSNAARVNSFDALYQRASRCASERGRVPTVLAVDFSDVGDLTRVVRKLNEERIAAAR